MPRSVRRLAAAWAQLLCLPDSLYAEGLKTAASLMVEPFPADATPDPDIPDTYILERGVIRVFYRVVRDGPQAVVDVVAIYANS